MSSLVIRIIVRGYGLLHLMLHNLNRMVLDAEGRTARLRRRVGRMALGPTSETTRQDGAGCLGKNFPSIRLRLRGFQTPCN